MVGRTRTVQKSKESLDPSSVSKDEDDENMDEERDGDDELLMGSQISSDPPRWRRWIYNNPDTIHLNIPQQF